jgi:hypothetical protein
VDGLTQALKGQPKPVQFAGVACELTRPTVMDAIVLADWVAKNPGEDVKASAFLVARHLHKDGRPVFETLEDVLQADWAAIRPLFDMVNQLYSEGGN